MLSTLISKTLFSFFFFFSKNNYLSFQKKQFCLTPSFLLNNYFCFVKLHFRIFLFSNFLFILLQISFLFLIFFLQFILFYFISKADQDYYYFFFNTQNFSKLKKQTFNFRTTHFIYQKLFFFFFFFELIQKDLKDAIFFFFLVKQTNKEINTHMQLDSTIDLGPRVHLV
jgi:hypothetical protein